MAKTLAKMIDSIKIDLKVFVDDHWLSNLDEFLADKINGINQTLMRQEFNNRGYVDQQYYQVHNCLEVECHQNTCTIDGIVFTFKGELHVVEIPKLLTGIGELNIYYFGLMDMMNKFTRGSFDILKSVDFRRYGSSEPVYTIVGDHAMIKNLPTGVNRLTLVGLFSNAMDACTFDSDTSAYPTPSEYNLELMVKKDLLTTWNIPFEERNDTKGIMLMPATQQPENKNKS